MLCIKNLNQKHVGITLITDTFFANSEEIRKDLCRFLLPRSLAL